MVLNPIDRSFPGRRWPRRLTLAAVIAGAAASMALFVVCWVVAGAMVRPGYDPSFDLRILGSGPGTVTLTSTVDTRRPGRFGLAWRSDDGSATRTGVLGDVLVSTDETVTRELVASSLPRESDPARMTVAVWTSDPEAAFGLSYEDVTYTGPLGSMPAWFVPGPRSTWVILVHGHGGDRTAGLRVMPALHALGYPILAISYRNDAGAPESEDRRRRLGETEWRDLEAAVRYATTQGASGVILHGWSMGGGIVENYLHRGEGAEIVRAVVLDSPALDWNAIIESGVRRLGLPGLVAGIQKWVLRLRTGIDVADIDMVAANRRAGGPGRPVLLFHGTEDTVVPFEVSAAFAEEWPDRVTWVPVEGAGHTQSWNVDPERYERELTAFLTRVDPRSPL